MEDGKVWLYVEVSDTGIGIRPEDQERIFEPFEEAEGKERGGAFAALEEQVWDSVSAAIFSCRMGSEIHVQSVPESRICFFFLKRHLNVRRANFFRRMKSRRGPGI